MPSWATEELKYAALPDKRLNQRLIKIVENLAGQPHGSVSQASGDFNCSAWRVFGSPT